VSVKSQSLLLEFRKKSRRVFSREKHKINPNSRDSKTTFRAALKSRKSSGIGGVVVRHVVVTIFTTKGGDYSSRHVTT